MMRWIVALSLVVAGVACAADPKPQKFPETKWFRGVDGLEEAKELQKVFDADIFVYFANYSPSDQKGLCNWFEKKSLFETPVQATLRDYLKVKIEFPLNNKDTAAVEPFGVNKCPAIFVVQPNGRRNRLSAFEWPDGKPELILPKDLDVVLRQKSSPKYQVEPK